MEEDQINAPGPEALKGPCMDDIVTSAFKMRVCVLGEAKLRVKRFSIAGVKIMETVSQWGCWDTNGR